MTTEDIKNAPEETPEDTNQEPQNPPAEDYLSEFEAAFRTDNPEKAKSDDQATKPVAKGDEDTTTNEEEEPEEETPAPEADFDMSLLDLELKRFDEKKTLKEFLKERPEDVKAALQQKWDYEARKEEWRTQKEAELAEINKQKSLIDAVILRNLAFEINAPLKTLEDFENDVRYDDAEAAYEQYRKEFQAKAAPFIAHKKKTEQENSEMIEDFSKTYKDVDVKNLFEEMRPYLNSSVAMGYVPFPPDALEVFYKGKNFDKLVAQEVEKAKLEERKKVLAEIKKKSTSTNLNNTPPSDQTHEKYTQNLDSLPEEIRAFEKAWSF